MMKSKEIVNCAVMTAMLITVQYALSFVSGIELVTVLFISYCYFFGIRCDILTGVAFSLLRCLLFGFMPHILVLYIAYYSLLALIFGTIGMRKSLLLACPCLLTLIISICSYFLIWEVPISFLFRAKISNILWILLTLLSALLLCYVAGLLLKIGGYWSERGLWSPRSRLLVPYCLRSLMILLPQFFLDNQWKQQQLISTHRFLS